MAEPSEDIESRLARLEQQEARLIETVELLARNAGAPPPRPGRNWDAVAALIAAMIGVLALAVSGYTAYIQRQQLRAQMWPRLQLEYANVNPAFYVLNQGVGPARITALRVTLDGVPVKSVAGLRAAAGFTNQDGLIQSSLNTTVMPPGKEIKYLQPWDSDESRARFKDLLLSGKHQLLTTICYCSVLDECWVASSDEVTRPAETCPIPDAERYTD